VAFRYPRIEASAEPRGLRDLDGGDRAVEDAAAGRASTSDKRDAEHLVRQLMAGGLTAIREP
jgi:hypothetical protein